MNPARVLFFGSTSDSVLVLTCLAANNLMTIVAVVTQPPKPVGREQILTPTPVGMWAKKHNIKVLSFPANKQKPWLYADELTVTNVLQPFKADLVVSACFGQKIPFGGINIHPSLLPRWRGADPVPWAIYSGDKETGVTIVQLSEIFDKGLILAQTKVPIADTDTADPLRTKLFTIGADLFIKTVPDILSGKIKGTPQNIDEAPYARRLRRDDGFEKWESIAKAFSDSPVAARIDRKFRAFTPWPGLWTKIATGDKKQETKRVKILSCHMSTTSCLILDSVQLEGKKPVPFRQFKDAYLSS